jgi:hypothetical protein
LQGADHQSAQLKERALSNKEKLFVVIGLDKDQKPRAAIFPPSDTVAATKAAGLLGLRAALAETPEALALAKQLPEGKVFATGKGLMPLVKRETFDKLLKLVTFLDDKPRPTLDTPAPTPSTAKAQAGPETAPKGQVSAPSSNPWDAIEVGAIVLWRVDPKEGWFECVLIATSKDRKKLTLKWRDFSGFKPFEVQRLAVGLICKIS